MNNPATVFLRVYYDCVKAEVSQDGRRAIIGWFSDEVAATSAAVERILFASSAQAWCRQLPKVEIRAEFVPEWAKRPWTPFKRATRVKHAPDGRRVVRVSNSFGKEWLQ